MLNDRSVGRERRKKLDKQSHCNFSKNICSKIQDLITNKNTIMIYNPIDGEVDVGYLKELENKVFLYPKVEGENMVAVLSEEFKKGSFGVLEPIGKAFEDKIDAVIVPMCSYDKKLNRLGFGKGYYDRFLKDKGSLKIGVAFSCQEAADITAKKTDIKMDIIVTEKDIYFGGNR